MSQVEMQAQMEEQEQWEEEQAVLEAYEAHGGDDPYFWE